MTRRRLLIVLLVILGYLQYRLWFGPGSWEQIVALTRDINAQQKENAGLHQRNERLVGEVESLKKDLDSIEERARAEMGLVKKDESFYMIVDDQKK